jgi:predicted nucleotidyltransferase
MDIFNDDFKDFIECLNKSGVKYILVGGYAVIIRGYSRSTGDMDVWVEKSQDNYQKLLHAIISFGLPPFAIPKDQFFSEDYDVFSFGRPPFAIEILTAVKGIDFEVAFEKSTMEMINEIQVRVVHLNHLIAAKKAAGRHKDFNDLENLPPLED